MQKSFRIKGIVFGVIALFIGTSSVLSVNSSITSLNPILSFESTNCSFRSDSSDDTCLTNRQFNSYHYIHNKNVNPLSNCIDIAVTYGNTLQEETDKWGFNVLLNDGNGSFYQRFDYAFEADNTPGIIAYDFNNDRCTDIVVSTYFNDRIVVYLGDGKGGFRFHQDYFLEYMPNRLVVGDFNEDGIADLAITLQDTGFVSILLGLGNGKFTLINNIRVGDNPIGINTADFNLDDHIDLVVANVFDDDISILYGSGNGDFTNRADYDAGDFCYLISTGDFNLDGSSDLLVSHFQDDFVRVFFNDGKGSFQEHYDINVGADYAMAIPVDDFNKDGYPDFAIALSHPDDNIVKLYFGDGEGGFHFVTSYFLGNLIHDMIACDLNDDGLPDLAATNRVDSLVCIRLNTGNGDFSEPIYFETGKYCYGIVTADFTNVLDNQPPDFPQISGAMNGTKGKEYQYTIITSDPNGDTIFYYIDWGDNTNSGWLGSYNSGQTVSVSNSWDSEGTYTVKVKAKDIYDAESDWATLTVTMPCSFTPQPQFIEVLFERFPRVFSLFRNLM